jgi:6-phosphogluconolactonase
MLTRRRFLVSLPLAFATISASAQDFLSLRKKKTPPPPAPVFVYFATGSSKGSGKGLYQSRFDPAKGTLTPPVPVAAGIHSSFLALSPPRNGPRFLYALNNPESILTFSIDAKSGSLHQIGEVPSAGAGPAYLSVDATGHSAFVADYSGSVVASFRIQPDGTLTQPIDRIDYKDRQSFAALGPVSARQDASHPHCATLSPDNRFLLVCDLGTDHITVFVIDPDTGHLTNPKLFTNNRPGSGPRHIAFHPNGRWVYGINELDSTIDRYLWTATRFSDVPQGLLVNTTNTVSTLAHGFPAAKNTAAEVAVSPDGAFLYASNRGEDTLVVFTVSAKDGHLTFLQRIACGGKTPRHFTLSPTGQWLLCGNQDSATVTVFHRDSGTGKLSGPIQTLALDSPLFTLFA